MEKAEVSESAKAKAASKLTPDGMPVHSFRTLLAGPGTLTLNDVSLPGRPANAFRMAARPAALSSTDCSVPGIPAAMKCGSRLNVVRDSRQKQRTIRIPAGVFRP